ncbi:hypothetical protein [Propionivibrio sp.]|nr:hypothetical protein [Propionivibrio sp.]
MRSASAAWSGVSGLDKTLIRWRWQAIQASKRRLALAIQSQRAKPNEAVA